MIPKDNPVELLKQGDQVFRAVLVNVELDQLDLPTPSDAWSVRLLISHVIHGNNWAEGHVRHGAGAWPDHDVVGDGKPVERYDQSFASLLDALSEPGALERSVELRGWPHSGATFAMMRVGDLVAHAWDLAKATGQSTDLAPELSEYVLEGSRQVLGETYNREADGQYKLPVPISDAAPAADRLAAFLGKQV